MLRGMELRHLRYFVAVAEEQNVTRAAARLRVSQPPLSRQIRDLEDELGVALFDHGAKAVRLTEAGRVFLTEARAALRRVEDAVQMAKAVADGQRGEIHVGYAPSLAVELLPSALKFFQEAKPGVGVQLHDSSTQEMLRGLRDGKLHVAMLVQVSAKVLAEFVFEELQWYAVCVAMHPAHPLGARAKSDWNKSPRNASSPSPSPTTPSITHGLQTCPRHLIARRKSRRSTTARPASSRQSRQAGASRWFHSVSIVWLGRD